MTARELDDKFEGALDGVEDVVGGIEKELQDYIERQVAPYLGRPMFWGPIGMEQSFAASFMEEL